MRKQNYVYITADFILQSSKSIYISRNTTMPTFIPNLQHFFVAASDTLSPATLFGRAFRFGHRISKTRQKRRLQQALVLNRMARDLDTSQPSLAAELRSFASR